MRASVLAKVTTGVVPGACCQNSWESAGKMGLLAAADDKTQMVELSIKNRWLSVSLVDLSFLAFRF